MKKTLLTLHFLFLLTLSSISQAQVHMGINASTGFPLNEFHVQTPGTAFGVNVNMFFPTSSEFPVYWGFDLNFQGIGARSVQKTASTDVGGLSVPVNFDIASKNKMFNGHLVLKVKIPTPVVQPYIEGLVGLKYFYTRTYVKDANSSSNLVNEKELRRNTEFVGESLQRSVAFSHGFGIGAQMMLNHYFGVNVGLRYLLGSPASYYTKEDIRDFDVSITPNAGFFKDEFGATVNSSQVSPRKSRTDMLTLNVGLTINFQ